MIVYIDLEHDRLRADAEQWERSLARRLKHKYRFEEIAGDSCLLVRYHRANPRLLRELKARAVLVSGCSTDFEHYDEKDLAGLRGIYREAAWPTMGFCAGHQLMAQAYGAAIGAMGTADGSARRKEEFGYMTVRVTRSHPLLEGLRLQPTLFQAHYWEVKSPPEGFKAYAESDLCGVQLMAHDRLPLFGAQFHPEEYDDAHPDGRKVVENFFRVAGII